jgi:hypothetical protein
MIEADPTVRTLHLPLGTDVIFRQFLDNLTARSIVTLTSRQLG